MNSTSSRASIIDLTAEYDISDEILHQIALGTAAKSGTAFFRALVEHVAKALGADMVFVTECTLDDLSEVRTLANWYKGRLAEEFEYNIAPYPCAHVMRGSIYVHSSQLLEAYPNEIEGMESYIGLPLVGATGAILGHLVVMNEHPIDERPRGLSALRIFAARAAAEIERLQFEMRLTNSEERYRVLFDTNPLPIFVFDVDTYEIIAVNRSATRVYGYSVPAFQAMRFCDLMSEPDREGFDKWLTKPLLPDQPWDSVFDHHAKAGETLTVQLSRRFLRFEGRSACLSLANDITERRRIEYERDQAYQSLEQRVMERTHEIQRRQQIAESLREVLKTLNSQGTIEDILTYITQKATTLLGADAVVTCQYFEDEDRCALRAHHGLQHLLLSTEDEPPGWELIRGRIGDLMPIAVNSGEVTTKSRAGSLYQQQFQALLAVPLAIRTTANGYLILYYIDPHVFAEEEIRLAVTFADQMELALENSHLRQEAERLAAYEERNRLARDLHDAVTQTLWSASLLADIIPTLWQRNPDRAAERLEQLRQLNRVALQEMRALLLGLRPKALAESKLDDLLRQLISTTEAQAPLQIQLKASGVPGGIPAELQIAYYRVAQEALNNVIRHSGATQAIVSLACGEHTANSVTMVVQDNGRGFEPTTITSDHFGTRIMRERANLVRAQLTVSSRPGSGTTVEMKWPAVEG